MIDRWFGRDFFPFLLFLMSKIRIVSILKFLAIPVYFLMQTNTVFYHHSWLLEVLNVCDQVQQ